MTFEYILGTSYKNFIAGVEKAILLAALEAGKGNKTTSAQLVHLNRTTFVQKLVIHRVIATRQTGFLRRMEKRRQKQLLAQKKKEEKLLQEILALQEKQQKEREQLEKDKAQDMAAEVLNGGWRG